MTNEEKASQIALEICGEPTEFDITGEYPCSEEAAMKMAEWKDKHPSDETIMLILNCVGYEEPSWLDFVKKRLEKE